MISVEELIKRGDALFSDRMGLMSLWQEIADLFYVERADFTTERWMGSEFADHLGTSEPLLIRRELGDGLGGMLRRDNWFQMTVQGVDRVDTAGRQWLNWQTRRMRDFMYEEPSQFTRVTKMVDHDYVSFGNGVIQPRLATNGESLLYQSWHLRDVAWAENMDGAIDEVHRKWTPTAGQLMKQFGQAGPLFNLHKDIGEIATKDPFTKIPCRHVVVTFDEYGKKWPSIARAEPKYMVCLIDVERKHLIFSRPANRMPYVIPRWALLQSGTQYGFSPAVMAGLPNARTMQAVIITLLEAGEKFVNPPLIGVEEALRDDMDMRAGGFTPIDAAYDERLGEVLRPLTQDRHGVPIGFEMLERVNEELRRCFFLDQIDLPPIDSKAMTAFEFNERMKQFSRKVLPLFDPVEENYSAPICEATADILFNAGAFGSVYDIPESLRGREIKFKFESPLREAAEKAKAGELGQMLQILEGAIQFDPELVAHANLHVAVRETLEAVSSADWVNTEDMVATVIDKMREDARAQRAMMAAESTGRASKDLAKAANDTGLLEQAA